MIIKTGKLLVMVFVLLFMFSSMALAWLRPYYEDAIVVERSELIVVAHLKKDSIEYVPHKKKPHEGSSWEHHATLVITEVLKGKCNKNEIPIIIHYGLTPVIGGYIKRKNFMINRRRGSKNYPKDIIEIIDTGNSCRGLPPRVEDAGKPNLWFLRKRSGIYGRKPGTGKFGIVDPADLQPLEVKDYFLAYLSDDPEKAVKEYMQKNPDKAARAKRYLDHLEVQRILEIKGVEERYDKLLPFFLNRMTWNMKSEARNGIVSCGQVAGERLMKLFNDPEHKRLRHEIIRMWREIGYKKAAPILIEMLKEHDKFWEKQKLEKGWWNRNVESEETRRQRHQRREIYGEVYHGVCALRSFKDPEAKEALEMTRDRWKAINFDNTQIVEACEAALRELSAPNADKQHR